jgi:3',5'-nucleoside bisphosphate phosphatase
MIDLHVHTKASDGTLPPEEVVRHAASAGLTAIAITDHDTLDGVARAQAEGERIGIEVIPGIEISAQWQNGILHILGYYVDPEDPQLLESLHFLQSGRHERIPRILSKLAALDVHISPEQVERELAGGVPGRPHVANAMVKNNYVKNIQEAFDLYLGYGAPAYVDKRKLASVDAVKLIANASKLCVLAHPYSLGTKSVEHLTQIIKSFMPYGLAGIEAYYPKHTAAQTQVFIDVASNLGLAITGGTDFHGSNKPEIEIGVVPGIGPLPYSILSDLKKIIKSGTQSTERNDKQERKNRAPGQIK